MDHEHPELWDSEKSDAVSNKKDVSEPVKVYQVAFESPDPLKNLNDVDKELMLTLNSLSEKQKQALLQKAKQQAAENEEIHQALLARNHKKVE